MLLKEILGNETTISTRVFAEDGEVEGVVVTQYGLEVTQRHGDVTVSSCRVADISPDRDYVCNLARRIREEHIPPSLVYDFVEEQLSR